jgi:hypothetical protein
MGCKEHSESSKKAYVTYIRNYNEVNPKFQDTLEYSNSKDKSGYMCSLNSLKSDDKDTYLISDDFKKINHGSRDYPLVQGKSYQLANREYYTVYKYWIQPAMDGGFSIVFSPDFGILVMRFYNGDIILDYPHEEYFLKAKTLALNVIADCTFWEFK